ncbi:MAG: sigma-70 family RNA polymerase sigma factor [Fuerstiella sp.]|nr:sigma-70 family RNA polymerase sigma factor [Fuerstiella sp.]MCP4857140.1 sigma-70 family RNA polymerase sigma factor [Fuerstiella sp.]
MKPIPLQAVAISPDNSSLLAHMFDSPHNSEANTASASLIRRVKSRDQDAWRRLVKIYGPLVYRWARQSGLQEADANDVVADVLVDVVKGVERFQDDGKSHSFRRWLRTVSSRKISKHNKHITSRPAASGGTTANLRLQDLPAVAFLKDDLNARDEIDWVRQQAMKILQGDCKSKHWLVFERTVLEGAAPADVAETTGMTVWPCINCGRGYCTACDLNWTN